MIDDLETSHDSSDNLLVQLTFSDDQRYAAIADWEAVVYVWNLMNGSLMSCLQHSDLVVAITFSADGRYLATACEDSTAQVWELSTGKNVAALVCETGVSQVVFSADGNYLFTFPGSTLFPLPWQNQRNAVVWEVATRRQVFLMPVH